MSKPRPRHPGVHRFVPIEREITLSAPPDSGAWRALPGSSPKPMTDLRPHECRWPLGDHPFLFCAAPATPGVSYCPEHHKMAYVAPKGTE